MAVMNGQHLLHPYFYESDAAFLKAYMTTLETNEESVLHRYIHEQRIYLLSSHLEDPTIDINVRNQLHDSPLMAALKIRNKEVSYLLVQKILDHDHVDINLPDFDGETPLHEIAKNISPSRDIMLDKVLKHPKCNINITNYLGETPLHVAKTVTVAKKLIESGADVNFKDNSNNIPLHKQVRNHVICQMIIENGSSINAKNFRGLTPLHEAAACNQLETVLLLIEKGADANIETCYTERHTPLYTAYSCYASSDIKEQLWLRSEPKYLLFVGNFESSKVPQIIQEWSSLFTKEEEIVKFIISLINILKYSRYLNYVSCGRIVGEYFLNQVHLLSLQSCHKLFKKFESHFQRSLLNFLIKSHDYSRVNSQREIETMIDLLREKGEVLDYSDFEVIYLQFGDCVLIHKLLRYKVVPKTRKLRDILLFPRTLLSITTDLTEIIKSKDAPFMNLFDFYDLHNLARYCTFSRTFAEELSLSYHNIIKCFKSDIWSEQLQKDLEIIQKNSGVPTLLELCRNKVRPTLCRKYNIGTAYELYSVLEMLGIPPLIISVIMFELPVHYKISKPTYVPYYRMAYSL